MGQTITIEDKPLLELNKKLPARVMTTMGVLFLAAGAITVGLGHYVGIAFIAASPALLWLARGVASEGLVFTAAGVYEVTGRGWKQSSVVVGHAPWSDIVRVEQVVKSTRGSNPSTSITLVFERNEGAPLRYIVGLPPSREQQRSLARLCKEREIACRL